MRFNLNFGRLCQNHTLNIRIFGIQNNHPFQQLALGIGLFRINLVRGLGQGIKALALQVAKQNLLGISLDALFAALNKGRGHVETQNQVGNRHQNRQAQARIHQGP